jgi:hypothetical protein
MRAWRKKHPLAGKGDYVIARAYARVYVRRGKLIPQPCIKCGAKAEIHHPDYRRPLDVIWLCRAHHLELHRELRNAAQQQAL